MRAVRVNPKPIPTRLCVWLRCMSVFQLTIPRISVKWHEPFNHGLFISHGLGNRALREVADVPQIMTTVPMPPAQQHQKVVFSQKTLFFNVSPALHIFPECEKKLKRLRA